MSMRILLADDHVILRHSLSCVLAAEADMEIVGEADNGHIAVEMVRKLTPDVVVMDISMPVMNGIEATRMICKEYPAVKIIGLSMHSSDKYVREMFRAGASGYLLKSCPLEELIEAIRTVFGGKTYVSPLTAE